MSIFAEPRIELLPDAGFLIGDDIDVRSEGTEGTFQPIYAATGVPTKPVPLAGAPDMERAVECAGKAFPNWRWMRPDQRRQCFLRLAGLIRQNGDLLRELSAIESGLPVAISGMMVEVAAEGFEYFGGWTDKIHGEQLPTWPVQSLDYVIIEPYGVVAIMLPFNAPLIAAGITLPPALAAGNCIVVKPSSMAPFVILKLAELALEAGFPPGVINVMPADYRGGEALVRTPGVGKVLFMGSGRSAKYVCRAAGDCLIPVTTELGGKSAHLIFDDVDPVVAADLAVGSGIGQVGGQGCAMGTRLLVQRGIYDQFLEAAVASAKTLVKGCPLHPDTQLGPMVNEQAANRIVGVCERAVAENQGRLLIGGTRMGGEFAQGAYVEPTLFADVENTAPVAAEEIFGPVLTICPFDTDQDAVRMANDSEFGLSAYVQTDDALRMIRLSGLLQAGSVHFNGWQGVTISAPFGGTKASGFGRLGGYAAIKDMTYEKNISIAAQKRHGKGTLEYGHES